MVQIAVRVAQHMMRLGMMYRPREGGEEPFTISTDVIYKFVMDDHPRVLNMRRKWGHLPRPALEVALAVENHLESLIQGYVSPDGLAVDYKG